MKNVRDIFDDARRMQREGLPPRKIASHLVDIGCANRFVQIREEITGTGGATLVELTFKETGEVVCFDGHEWRYAPTVEDLLRATPPATQP